jgi:Fe-S-cluster containining protein
MTENIRTQCEGCGMCCKAIYLPLTHSQMTDDLDSMRANRDKPPIVYDFPVRDNFGDQSFAKQNFYPLTKDEVLQINPHLETWRAGFEEAGVDFDDKLSNNFYGCIQLNKTTGRCMTHDNLPKVCSGYPWYGREPSQAHEFYTEDCFYKKDLIERELSMNE